MPRPIKPDAPHNVKAAVRRRDGFCCVQCGMTNDEHIRKYSRQLEVHRKTPGSIYVADDCVTLCKTCHGPKPTVGPRSPGWVPRRTEAVRVPLDLLVKVKEIFAKTKKMNGRYGTVGKFFEAMLWPIVDRHHYALFNPVDGLATRQYIGVPPPSDSDG